ncbi:hypothetical protein [Planobispora takensis]|uniref:Uncharacterized protein n=1 Tax=Planobispora takensis TaxID=1367882 RepID=A0A8J3SW35_9ACTN|nr:hypothetical protein [Planobispora takensis]GII01303.1 hypothetical protein Pta02_33110 [Planobispora takensis]
MHLVPRLPRNPAVLLALIAIVYVAVQPAVLPYGMPLEWDEAVYASQVAPGVPDAVFSAPRARGIVWLVAPVVYFTRDPVLIRLWMTLLSGIGFYLAFLPWAFLLRRSVLVLSAALFGGLWTTLLYGTQVMPNLYVAFGCTAAAGCLLLALRGGPARAALAGLGASVAAVAVLRPGDALWLALPLAAVSLLRRRVKLAAVTSAGVVAGFVPWIIEAYVSYGDPLSRWRAAGEVQGGLALSPGFLHQFKTANGPVFCRPCTIPLEDPWPAAWWVVLPVLALAGAIVSLRSVSRDPVSHDPASREPVSAPSAPGVPAAVVAAVTGFSVAVPYLLLVDYGAPRFLLPAYALLAVPAAEFLVWLVARRASRVAAGAVAVALLAHTAVQMTVLVELAGQQDRQRGYNAQVVRDMAKRGVRPPCTMVDDLVDPAMTFVSRCDTLNLTDPGDSLEARMAAAEPGRVFVLLTKKEPPAAMAGWQRYVLREKNGEPLWTAYITRKDMAR